MHHIQTVHHIGSIDIDSIVLIDCTCTDIDDVVILGHKGIGTPRVMTIRTERLRLTPAISMVSRVVK